MGRCAAQAAQHGCQPRPKPHCGGRPDTLLRAAAATLACTGVSRAAVQLRARVCSRERTQPAPHGTRRGRRRRIARRIARHIAGRCFGARDTAPLTARPPSRRRRPRARMHHAVCGAPRAPMRRAILHTDNTHVCAPAVHDERQLRFRHRHEPRPHPMCVACAVSLELRGAELCWATLRAARAQRARSRASAQVAVGADGSGLPARTVAARGEGRGAARGAREPGAPRGLGRLRPREDRAIRGLDPAELRYNCSRVPRP
jgi:hypothetical protein